MNSAPRDPHRRPYWLLPVFAALMVIPTAWASGALIAATIAVLAVRVGRAVAARRGSLASEGTDPATVLGVDGSGREVRLSDRQLSAHALILGASGAGKSTTLLRILTDHVRRGLPVVAIDMKGSPAFARQLADAAAASGRPFRLWSPDGPCHWNPLGHGNATELKDKLIATERFTEPHYQRAAERYIQTVLQVLHADRPDRPPTLAEVVDLMDPRRLPAMLRGLPPELVERVTDYVADLPPDQLSAIRGLGARLAIITEAHTGRYLSAPDAAGGSASGTPIDPIGGGGTPSSIDLRDALDGRQVVLFSLNSSRYGQLAAQIGTMAVQDLVSVVGRRLWTPPAPQGLRTPPAPQGFGGPHRRRGDSAVHPRLRRCGAGRWVGQPPSTGGDRHRRVFGARGRSSGLVARPRPGIGGERPARDAGARRSRSGRSGVRDQVMGVTAVKIAHRQDVPSSAQTIAQMAGTRKAWEETRQLARWSARWLRNGTRHAPPGRAVRCPSERDQVAANR